MVKLKNNGMSAVAAFFGQEGRSSDTNPTSLAAVRLVDQTTAISSSQRKRTNRNLGVGATPKIDVEDKEMDVEGVKIQETTTKLLRIVRGKERTLHHEEEDSDVDVNTPHHSDSDDDGEEREGRTSVIKEKEIDRPENLTQFNTKKKKSKKKKQDGGDINKEGNPNDHITDLGSYEASTKTFHTDRLESLASYKEERIRSDGPPGTFKRTKTRSKQKNIRKDTRGYKKPSHLIPGRSDFDGRGLTMATRAYLGLPDKPQLQETRKHQHKEKTFDQNKVDAFTELAVDNLLLDVGKLASSGRPEALKNISVSTDKERTPAKKVKFHEKVKKSKYKNLM